MQCRRDLLVVLAVGASKGKARSPNDLLRRAGRLARRFNAARCSGDNSKGRLGRPCDRLSQTFSLRKVFYETPK
jgi:hypothetical protein